MIYHVEKPDSSLRAIINATFPNYRGKTFKLSTEVPSRLDSYWEGGSKDSFAFYQLTTGKALDVHSNHPMFEAGRPRQLPDGKLPDGILLVKHTYFCGTDLGVTVYANKANLVPMLPESNNDISDDEKTVLKYTRSLKNSYGGETNIRFKEAHRDKGISADDWESAKSVCIVKGLLKKNGAITPAGRNAIADIR